MTEFGDEDLTGATFRETTLDGARMIGVVMRDAVIDGLVTNLVVNEVEVTAYVEAELDRRHPVRPLLRSDDAADLRQGWAQLQADWAATYARLASGADGIEHVSVRGEWSAVQTLRHLVFVTDTWFLRSVLGRDDPLTPIGLPAAFFQPAAGSGLDADATPSLDEVLAVRRSRVQEVTAYLDRATTDSLQHPAPRVEGEGWPPPKDGRTILDCLHVLLGEEWAHHRFCVRDLDRIEAKAP